MQSAGNWIALLEEEDDELKVVALENLNRMAADYFYEISESLPQIEALAESEVFRRHELASLVAAKIHFHLDSSDTALRYALGAGSLFDVATDASEFGVAMLTKCMDEYSKARQQQSAATTKPEGVAAATIDKRLEGVVEGLFSRSLAAGQFKTVIGSAVDCRRLDIIEHAASSGGASALEYCKRLALGGTNNNHNSSSSDTTTTPTTHSTTTEIQQLPRQFRSEVLRLLERLYRAQPKEAVDYPSLVQCLSWLDDAPAVAQVVYDLAATASENDNSHLMAYQVSFDLVASAPQRLLQGVKEALGAKPDLGERSKQLIKILDGDLLIDLHLEFMYRNNKTDMLLLNTIKQAIEQRNSTLHQATVFCNSLMHAGTTVDTFLRENLEWLSKATNWAKFSATAGLGVIHKGHHGQALQLLAPYLPAHDAAGAGAAAGGSPYSEGGALYALGLIHANHGAGITGYLQDALNNPAASDIVHHGCCLGLGLAGMASGDERMYEQIRDLMYAREGSVAGEGTTGHEGGAVVGEAAGLAIGLIMLGTASQHAVDLLTHAHETQHERVTRGCSLGVALTFYGRQEEADTMIDQMLIDKDPVIRYGGMYTIAMAYAGTGSTVAVRRLLHEAVTDVSDDVRRAALTSLGFVLFRQPRQCPHLVSLLTDSFNPHVRYGATMALGISCAGTALPEAITLLEPMTRDPVDFVRQGAMIALALILTETSKTEEPRVEAIAKIFQGKISEKLEEVMSKVGAILATGLMNAGGRNMAVSLATASGHTNLRAVVGLAVFCQYWYWLPYVHFVSLAYSPTAVIALDSNLKPVPLKFKSNAAPSTYAYPSATKPPEKVAAAKGPSAVLSYGRNKQQAKATTSTTPATTTTEAMEVEKKEKEEKEKKEAEAEKERKDKAEAEKKEKEKEPAFEILQSPCRVTLRQRKCLTFDFDQRFSPVKTTDVYGVVMVRDNQPEPVVVADAAASSSSAPATDAMNVQTTATTASEPAPPAPFQLPE